MIRFLNKQNKIYTILLNLHNLVFDNNNIQVKKVLDETDKEKKKIFVTKTKGLRLTKIAKIGINAQL